MCLLKELGLFNEFVSTPPADVAAGMGSVPSVGKSAGKRKKGKTSSTKKKKGKSEEGAIGAVDLLQRMERHASLDSKKEELGRLRYQLSTEETLLLNVESSKSSIAKEYFEWKKIVRDNNITEMSSPEEWEYFTEVKSNFDGIKVKIKEVTSRIEELKGLIASAESDLEEQQKKLAQDEEGVDEGDVEEGNVEEESSSDDDAFSVRSIGSNDGSVDIDAENIPAPEQVN